MSQSSRKRGWTRYWLVCALVLVAPLVGLPFPSPQRGAAFAQSDSTSDWLAGVGTGIDGLAYLWGGAEATLIQEFGPSDYSVHVHPEFYTYSLAYGFSQPGHTGLDIGIPAGTPLYAPSDGGIAYCAGTGNPGFPEEESCAAFQSATPGPTSGRLQIELPNGDMLIYGHVDDCVVKPGESVKSGQLLGHSGGSTDLPNHVHLEYRTPDPTTESGWRIVDPRLTPINQGTVPTRSSTPITTPAITDTPAPNTPAPARTPTATATPVGESPREFSYRGDFYLRDRVVPVERADLTEVTAYQGFIVYGRTADGPFAALYIPVSKRARDGMVRYLPEQLNRPAEPCPAEDPRAAIPSPWKLADGSEYVFAGYEPDVTGPLMTELAPNVFYETGSSLPLRELFVKVADGYQRYDYLDGAATVPVEQLVAGIAFAGQPLTYRKTLDNATGLGPLVRIGCAGPFKVSATLGSEDPPFSRVYVEVGGKLVVFGAGATED
jgi:murein DD-endopeptidase MepM/ murein hydrolase activator NlpD